MKTASAFLCLLDMVTGRLNVPPDIPFGFLGGLQWHHNNWDLAFILLSARSTSDIYSLDAANGQIV